MHSGYYVCPLQENVVKILINQNKGKGVSYIWFLSVCSLERMMLKLNSSTLATSCEELTHWKRLWCWEGLGAGGKGDNRGWDGWMASPTQWTWVWVNSGRWWWTGRPGVLQFMGSQRVGHDWATKLNWTELNTIHTFFNNLPSYLGILFPNDQ